MGKGHSLIPALLVHPKEVSERYEAPALQGFLARPPRTDTARGSPPLGFPTCAPGSGATRTLTGSAAPQQSGAGKAALRVRGRAGWGYRAGRRPPPGVEWRVPAALGAAGWLRAAGLGRRARLGPERGRAVAGGSPPPLTRLSSCLHLFLQHPFLILLLSLFPLPPSSPSRLLPRLALVRGEGRGREKVPSL